MLSYIKTNAIVYSVVEYILYDAIILDDLFKPNLFDRIAAIIICKKLTILIGLCTNNPNTITEMKSFPIIFTEVEVTAINTRHLNNKL